MIRRAEHKDAEKIMDLLLQVLMVHQSGRPDYFKPNCRKYTDAELAAIIDDDTRPIFVCDEDGVKGYAFCMIEETKGDNVRCDMKTLYIDDLCVDERERGKHVGKKLYEHVKKYAKEIGCYNLTLNVWECNPSARAFYDKQGLTPLKTTLETIL